MMKRGMPMQVNLRFAAPSNTIIERVMGVVLTVEEAATVRLLIGGFYYTTDKTPKQVLDAFEAEGFDFEDFRSIAFEK